MVVQGKSAGDQIFDIVNVLLVLLLTLIFLYPMWFVFVASISNPARLMVHTGIMLWPDGFSLEGYREVFTDPDVLTGYLNTLFYVGVGTVFSMFMTTLGAYVTSRKDFYFRKLMLPFIVLTMYVNAGLIPDFLLVRYLGLYNTRWALIFPAAIGTWNLIVMRTSFLQVPTGLEESAKIDGANHWTILWRIIFPVTKATFAVISLYYVVGKWNSWFNAMVYLQDRTKFPLQLFLREILVANSTSSEGMIGGGGEYYRLDQLIKYCTIIVSTVPVLCIYPFVQRYFIKGVMLGSLKE
ncbi:MAG TPA: carbohydrate ABC transporter permease [Candidatus Merdivicinus faecavium]|nr:carbohydrate ABC transporter permease [Candidatus Merdivicinus faecavium]